MKLNWPFRRQNRKSAGPILALSGPGAARWGNLSGESLVRDGYLRNAIVYRCVRMVAEAAASVLLKCQDDGASRLMSRPSPDKSGTELLESIYAQLQLLGETWVEAVTIDGDTAPTALYGLRASRVRRLTDAHGWSVGWAIREKHGERIVSSDEAGWASLLQLKTYNPVDENSGLSPLGAARRALDLHNASSDWAKALMDNSARPSGALVYGGDGAMTDAQFDALKAQLDAEYTGPDNAGRPLLLEGGLDWKPMSLSPVEMDYLAARHAAAREIALALGVPPMLLGIPGDNTYSNYKEANLALWRLTVLPLVKRVSSALQNWLAPKFGEGLSITPDLDGVSAFASERDAYWARLESVSFLTPDEKRRLAGLTA